MWHGKQKRIKNELEKETPSGTEETNMLAMQGKGAKGQSVMRGLSLGKSFSEAESELGQKTGFMVGVGFKKNGECEDGKENCKECFSAL